MAFRRTIHSANDVRVGRCRDAARCMLIIGHSAIIPIAVPVRLHVLPSLFYRVMFDRVAADATKISDCRRQRMRRRSPEACRARRRGRYDVPKPRPLRGKRRPAEGFGEIPMHASADRTRFPLQAAPRNRFTAGPRP